MGTAVTFPARDGKSDDDGSRGRVLGSAVQGKPGIATQVAGLHGQPHASEPQLSLREDHLSAADTGGAVASKGRESLVDVSVEEAAGQGG